MLADWKVVTISRDVVGPESQRHHSARRAYRSPIMKRSPIRHRIPETDATSSSGAGANECSDARPSPKSTKPLNEATMMPYRGSSAQPNDHAGRRVAKRNRVLRRPASARTGGRESHGTPLRSPSAAHGPFVRHVTPPLMPKRIRRGSQGCLTKRVIIEKMERELRRGRAYVHLEQVRLSRSEHSCARGVTSREPEPRSAAGSHQLP